MAEAYWFRGSDSCCILSTLVIGALAWPVTRPGLLEPYTYELHVVVFSSTSCTRTSTYYSLSPRCFTVTVAVELVILVAIVATLIATVTACLNSF